MNRIKWIELFIVVILLVLVSLCFASWDNDLPADNSVWNDAAGEIRDNWDALEAALGVDLSGAANIFNIKGTTYGAIGDDSTDDATAIQAAIDAAEAVNGSVYIPNGTYKFSTALTIGAGIRVIGESREGAILKKYGDIVGITINTNEYVLLEHFTLNAGTNTQNGITITEWARGIMNDIAVKSQGSHGVEFIKGNLSTFRDCIFTSNSGDGFKVNGTHDGPNTNACVFQNLDCRSNTGWGFNLENGRANYGVGISCQNNTGGGIRLNDRSNFLMIYAEGNTGDECELTSETNCKGNMIWLGNEGYTDNSAGDNTIMRDQRGSIYDTNYNKLTADKFILDGTDSANNTSIGVMTFAHTDEDGTITDKEYAFIVVGSSTDQTLHFKNSVTSQYLNIIIDGRLTVGRMIVPGTVTFDDSDATPSVIGNSFTSNTTGVTITRFDDCIAGQVFNVISKGAIVYDTSPASRLIGSSTDITTASGDTTLWVCETGGTSSSVCRLLNWVDVSQNNSSASAGLYGQ